jgi:hypothetical protein
MKGYIRSQISYINVLVFFCFTFLFTYSHAQNTFVQVQGDVRLDSLVEKNIAANKEANGVQGYRIQIFFGSERKAAHDARAKFAQLNPDVETYLVYQQPYFKVRVGDFRTRLEAQPLLKKVLPEFERVFIIPDKINLPKL